jgi:hypothetical protein
MFLLDFRVHRACVNRFARRGHDRRWAALRLDGGDGITAHIVSFSL